MVNAQIGVIFCFMVIARFMRSPRNYGKCAEVFGMIIVVRQIMVTILATMKVGACISGVRTTYVLCVQLQELIKAVRLLVLR